MQMARPMTLGEETAPEGQPVRSVSADVRPAQNVGQQVEELGKLRDLALTAGGCMPARGPGGGWLL